MVDVGAAAAGAEVLDGPGIEVLHLVLALMASPEHVLARGICNMMYMDGGD